ncbi:hypothetical protein EJB05_35026, partial [Eragrostis curvula]
MYIDKNLLRPQPRLRTGFFSVLECSMIPAGYIPEACTSVGAAKYGRPLGLDERIKLIQIQEHGWERARGYLISKRSMLLQYILQVDNQSNSVRALQSAHRISDNQQTQRVPGAHCQPCPPHLLPLEKWNWWEVDWDSLGEERELLVFVRALKMFRDEVLSRVNAMASALLPLPWKEKQQQ